MYDNQMKHLHNFVITPAVLLLTLKNKEDKINITGHYTAATHNMNKVLPLLRTRFEVLLHIVPVIFSPGRGRAEERKITITLSCYHHSSSTALI